MEFRGGPRFLDVVATTASSQVTNPLRRALKAGPPLSFIRDQIMANTLATPFDELMRAIHEAFMANFNEPTSVYVGVHLWRNVMRDERSLPYLFRSAKGDKFRGLNVYVIVNDINHLRVI